MKFLINKFGYELGTFIAFCIFLLLAVLAFPWFVKAFVRYLQWVSIA